MIDIKVHNGEKVVDSYLLYNKIGLNKSVYSRWIRNVRNRGGRDIDWFLSEDLKKINLKVKSRCYLTLDFARALCIQYKTRESNQLIVFLKTKQKE